MVKILMNVTFHWCIWPFAIFMVLAVPTFFVCNLVSWSLAPVVASIGNHPLSVASHLQKYRLYLVRLQKQNEERILGAARQDFSNKGPSENLNLRSSFQEQPSNISSGYPHPSQKIEGQNSVLDSQLEDTKRTVPLLAPSEVFASVQLSKEVAKLLT